MTMSAVSSTEALRVSSSTPAASRARFSLAPGHVQRNPEKFGTSPSRTSATLFASVPCHVEPLGAGGRVGGWSEVHFNGRHFGTPSVTFVPGFSDGAQGFQRPGTSLDL